MDRKKAIEIMNLDEFSTKDQIIKRYNILSKKFNGMDIDENGFTFKDITKAYNILMDIPYTDNALEEKLNRRKQNPNKVLKLIGTNEEKVENFFYHYKWHVVASIVCITLVFLFIASIVSKKPIDFTIDCIGYMTFDDENGSEKIEEYIVANIENIRGVETQCILFSDQPEYDQQMKIMVETAGNDVDIYIVDRNFFNQYAQQGLFRSVDKLAQELEIIEDRNITNIVERDLDGGIISKQPSAQYGFSVTDNMTLKTLGIEGNDIIICVGVKTKNIENVESFIKLIMKN